MSNLKSLIYKNGNKLNDSENQIIHFVLNNPELCSNLSLSKLAKKLYVSESAIFRLCKKLGLSGYSEFKFDLAELAKNKNEAGYMKSDFAEELTKSIDDVLKYFKSLDLKKLFYYLENANNIYIYSTGWLQQLIAEYLSHELLVFGVHSTVLPSALSELCMVYDYVQSGDVLFIISFTGDNEAINDELMKFELTNDKFKCVSFTDMNQNTLASLSDFNFYYSPIAFTEDPDIVNDKVAFASAYYLVDLLISEYVMWREKSGKEDKNGGAK